MLVIICMYYVFLVTLVKSVTVDHSQRLQKFTLYCDSQLPFLLNLRLKHCCYQS